MSLVRALRKGASFLICCSISWQDMGELQFTHTHKGKPFGSQVLCERAGGKICYLRPSGGDRCERLVAGIVENCEAKVRVSCFVSYISIFSLSLFCE